MSSRRSETTVRRLALVLTVLTGFSGLVYEVTWQKYVATLLGADSEATAAVLAIFLGGLALGYSLFGAVTHRRMRQRGRTGAPPRLLRFYGAVEAGIGLYALAFPTLFGVAQSVSLWVPGGHEALGFTFDLVLTALLLLPPTVLMGGTIPVLTQALTARLTEATRVHAWVYGFNTVGAFLGALAGGFVLVPLLGLDGVLYAMGGVNLTAGALFAALGAWEGIGLAAPEPGATGTAVPAAGRSLVGYAAVALLAGFAMMCVQTVLNRVGALSFGASQFTFAMVAAVFVLCIALGSLAVSALSRLSPLWLVGSQWLLVVLLGALYFGLQDAPYWAHALRVSRPFHFYTYHGAAFLGMLAVLVVPIGLSGALLPLLFHHLRRDVGDLGGVAGRLYSWNTVGSLLGAVLGGYVLLYWFDLDQVYRIAVGALALGATLLTVLVLRLSWMAAGGVLAGCTLVLALLYPPWAVNRLTAGLFRNRKPLPYSFAGPRAFFDHYPRDVVFYRDDPTTTASVLAQTAPGGGLTLAIVTNGKTDSDLYLDYPTMAMVGLMPALLAEKYERAFVIGYGTGVTVGQLAALEGSREVTVAEISSGVLEAARLFDPENNDVSNNPKVRKVRSDAYRALLRSQGRFDVIASEPSNPWVNGVEMLFSEDFLRAARDRLEPGGVYAQWFHSYESDGRTVELVLRTYRAVFDHVALWYTTGPDLLLLGFRSPERALDVEQIRARFEQVDFQKGFSRAGIESFEALLAHEVLPLGVLNAADLPGPVHTLRHPILSDFAARAFFRGGDVELPRFAAAGPAAVGARNSLVRRAAGLDHGPVPEALLYTLADETCRRARQIECATILARDLADHPASDHGKQLLATQLEIKPADLEPLEDLYAQGKAEHSAEPSKDAIKHAQLLTQIFLRFYHHALPFGRAMVDRAWEGCMRPEQLEACQSGSRRARELLGEEAHSDLADP
jgi:spermidine synthase